MKNHSHRLIGERLRRRVDGSCGTSASPSAGHIPAEGEETNGEGGNSVCRCGDASIEDVSGARVAEKEEDKGRCEGDTWPAGINNSAPYWTRAVRAD